MENVLTSNDKWKLNNLDKFNAYQKKYHTREKYKQYQRGYSKRRWEFDQKWREHRKLKHKEYRKTEAYIAYQKEYTKSQRHKEWWQAYRKTEKYKAYYRAYRKYQKEKITNPEATIGASFKFKWGG